MKRTRQDRRNDFDEFYQNAKAIFLAFQDHDPKAEKFERLYMLSICPGSRAGGNNNRVVDIFWGNRPFESITFGNTWKTLSEYGATLLFECDDSGFVMISIYPAGTENKKTIESSISLKLWIDPIKLKKQTFLKRLWNDFMAYMECTSLDGNPTFFQRLRISYLRYFKHQVIDKKWTPTKFSLFYKEVLKWILTVGLSGVIIYLLSQLSQPTTTETEAQLKEVNKNLKTISIQLDNVLKNNIDIKTISITTDSVAVKRREILKSIDSIKTK